MPGIAGRSYVDLFFLSCDHLLILKFSIGECQTWFILFDWFKVCILWGSQEDVWHKARLEFSSTNAYRWRHLVRHELLGFADSVLFRICYVFKVRTSFTSYVIPDIIFWPLNKKPTVPLQNVCGCTWFSILRRTSQKWALLPKSIQGNLHFSVNFLYEKIPNFPFSTMFLFLNLHYCVTRNTETTVKKNVGETFLYTLSNCSRHYMTANKILTYFSSSILSIIQFHSADYALRF